MTRRSLLAALLAPLLFRKAAASIAITPGVITVEQVRSLFGLPPIQEAQEVADEVLRRLEGNIENMTAQIIKSVKRGREGPA